MSPILGIYASQDYVRIPPSSFESIATATGTGSSGTITFSSIPSTYKHLQIRWMARSSTVTDIATTIEVQFNGDTGTNYTRHQLYGTGATAVAAAGAPAGGILIRAAARRDGSSANTMGAAIVDIHDYTSTTNNKTLRAFAGADDNDTTGEVALTSGLWMNTSAINSISLAIGGNYMTSTVIALYGIKA